MRYGVDDDRPAEPSAVPADRLGPVAWRKSTASNPNGDCVELAALPGGGVGMRNSRDPHGPALIWSREAVAALLDGVRSGEFDDLIW